MKTARLTADISNKIEHEILSDKPVRDYSVEDLAGDQEQGETDPNSPVVIPNHVRSHDENDCRSGQKTGEIGI